MRQLGKKQKKAVSKMRTRAFDRLHQSSGTKEGERGIYRLAKGRERKWRCIKDEEGKVLVIEQGIKKI